MAESVQCAAADDKPRCWNLENDEIVSMRCSKVTSIPHLDELPTYDDFFQNYLLPNRPCLLGTDATKDWKCRQDWRDENGRPNFKFLSEQFGDAVVPVADCQGEKYSAQPKQDMTVNDYLMYWQQYIKDGYPETDRCLYLKDWHFTRAFSSYSAYSTPVYFQSDWLNEFWDERNDVDDDYRFVYMGPKGSWTPFHADVFRSYSWSANICGKKKWILFPPGQEDFLRDALGNLVYDVRDPALEDKNMYTKYGDLCQRFEVLQNAGEIIFVPSGWHHQVFNLEDTISINHNWTNGCSVDISWSFLKTSLLDVEREIADCSTMDGWHQQCQLILKASSGMDYLDYYRFMKTIATRRYQMIQVPSNEKGAIERQGELYSKGDNHYVASSVRYRNRAAAHGPCHKKHFLFDLSRIMYILENMNRNKNFLDLDFKNEDRQPKELYFEIKHILSSNQYAQ